MEKDLYINRSYSACIKAAYVLFSSNMKTILKRTWLPALLCAIFFTAAFLFSIPDKNIHDLGMSHSNITGSLMAFVYLLNFAASTWLVATVASLLNGKTIKGNLFRSVMLTGIQLILMILYIFIINFGSSFVTSFLISSKLATVPHAIIGGYVTALVILLLLFVFSLPFAFSTTRYIIDHETKLSEVFSHGYKMGLRHWGYQFTTYFLATLLLIVVTFIILIPLLVISMAQTFNQLGMLDGDANGAPGYFFWLLTATSLLTMYVITYVVIWCLFLSYYIYGSIETKEKNKKVKLKKQENYE
ncbi:MAG: hypothetical protein LKG25_03690 [Prevotella sp.]|jgi:hypothetical protein|nr:hypothetical protein [Prevotella sp.]MCI1281681.1 hypothetical protein [Prevotella sp.]